MNKAIYIYIYINTYLYNRVSYSFKKTFIFIIDYYLLLFVIINYINYYYNISNILLQ